MMIYRASLQYERNVYAYTIFFFYVLRVKEMKTGSLSE